MGRVSQSALTVLCLCALSFIAGRFWQIPGLPEASRGVSWQRDKSANETSTI